MCGGPHRVATLPPKDWPHVRSLSPVAERGASAVEYGLLVSGVAATIAIAVYLFGGGVSRLFTDTCDEVASATATASC